MNDKKKPTDAVREFAERYERRIAELEAALTCKRICYMEYQTDGMLRGWWRCSECGGAMDTIESCGGRKPPRWCGNCGAKVVFGCNDREGAQEMIITYTSSTRHGECKECGKSFIRRAIDAGDDGKLCRDCYLKQKDKQR